MERIELKYRKGIVCVKEEIYKIGFKGRKIAESDQTSDGFGFRYEVYQKDNKQYVVLWQQESRMQNERYNGGYNVFNNLEEVNKEYPFLATLCGYVKEV